MALATKTIWVDPALPQSSLEKNASMSPESGDLTEERSPTATPDMLVQAMEASQKNPGVEAEGPS